MNLWLLGGSNAGMRDGWATQMQTEAATEAQVEKHFLGAVGSLYALMRLLKAERDAEAPPDAIVLEFHLNDILLFEAGVLQPPLVADTLEAIANFCARRNIGLLFLCLEPQPDARRGLANAKRLARKLYAQAAARHRLAPCIWLEDIFEGPAITALYRDPNHLTPEASLRAAQFVLAKLRAGDAFVPRDSGTASHFDYVDATQARFTGPGELHEVTSKVFCGPFVNLMRGGASVWPGQGRLAALMLQSTDDSGAYVIRTERKAFRKNPRSQMQVSVRNLMLLHYSTRIINVRGDVEISLPKCERALAALPEDLTLLSAAPIASFDAQTLDIHGVIFWRPRNIIARVFGKF